MVLLENNTFKQNNLVIVCIADHPKAMTLLQTACNRALETGGIWRAVFIETPDYSLAIENGDALQRILRLLAQAKKMGGESLHLHAETFEQGINQLISGENKPALLIIGKNEFIGNEYGKQLSRLSPVSWDRAVNVIRKHNIALEIVPLFGQQYQRSWKKFNWLQIHHIAYALLAVGIAFSGASILEGFLPPALFRINNQNVGLLFMIACAFSAGRFGLLPGLIASATSILLVNYYFTVPYYAFKFANVTDTLNMVLFLSAAILISLFTSQMHGSAEKAAKRELNTQALFTLYRLATNAVSRQQALEELQQNLAKMLATDVVFFLPPALNPDKIEAAFPSNIVLNEQETKALDLCWREMKTTGLASSFYGNINWRFEPMFTPDGEIGVLGIRSDKKTNVDKWFGYLLTAIADQTATILEHIELKRSMEATRIREEREKLRSMLLSSVSHDLKTPLASIIGALNIYRSHGKKLTADKKEILIETALEESERLDSFITNILSMTHLESGKIHFKQEWHDSQSIIQHAIKRLEHRLRQHELIIHPFRDNLEVSMDMIMTSQVIHNVLENAAKYTPLGTLIEVQHGVDENKGFFYAIHDHGAGLPDDKVNHVFDKYARLQKQDSQIAGTGLGLAISKAMMEIQGGSITAANHPEGGAMFMIYLPHWRKVEMIKYKA